MIQSDKCIVGRSKIEWTSRCNLSLCSTPVQFQPSGEVVSWRWGVVAARPQLWAGQERPGAWPVPRIPSGPTPAASAGAAVAAVHGKNGANMCFCHKTLRWKGDAWILLTQLYQWGIKTAKSLVKHAHQQRVRKFTRRQYQESAFASHVSVKKLLNRNSAVRFQKTWLKDSYSDD